MRKFNISLVLLSLLGIMKTEEIVYRELELGDYNKGFIDVLGELTDVGVVTEEMFEETYNTRNSMNIITLVAEDKSVGRVIATGAFVPEHKFIHGCATYVHIEDIVVSKDYRGKNIGAEMISRIKKLGKEKKYYKNILSCSEKNIEFYAKQGFSLKGHAMENKISPNEDVDN